MIHSFTPAFLQGSVSGERVTVYSIFEGILPRGSYLPCVSMAGRALFGKIPSNIEGDWVRNIRRRDMQGTKYKCIIVNNLYNFEVTTLSSIIFFLVYSLFCFMTETWLGGVPQGSLFLYTLAHTWWQGWQGALTHVVTWQDGNFQTNSTVLWERRKGGSEANAFSVDQDLTLKMPRSLTVSPIVWCSVELSGGRIKKKCLLHH